MKTLNRFPRSQINTLTLGSRLNQFPDTKHLKKSQMNPALISSKMRRRSIRKGSDKSKKRRKRDQLKKAAELYDGIGIY
jgi:hypothetical protein